MDFKPIEISLCTSGFCLACGGTGKLKAKRKAMQFNGSPIDYDEVSIPCVSCNGTGLTNSNNSAPRSRHTEK